MALASDPTETRGGDLVAVDPVPHLSFKLHLNSGNIVQIISECDEDDASEQIAEEIRDELNEDRPKWIAAGNVAFFSGAVSAIEIDTYNTAA